MERTLIQFQFRTDTDEHFQRDVAQAIKLLVEIDQPLVLRAGGLVQIIDAVADKANAERQEQFTQLCADLFSPGFLLFLSIGVKLRDTPQGATFLSKLFCPCLCRQDEAATLPSQHGIDLAEYIIPIRNAKIASILAETEEE